MRKAAIFLAVLACTSGCATIQNGITRAGESVCNGADSFRLGYLAMLNNAVLIENPVIRQSVIGTAQAGLAALDNCPAALQP